MKKKSNRINVLFISLFGRHPAEWIGRGRVMA
jgi:hypothetical protein